MTNEVGRLNWTCNTELIQHSGCDIQPLESFEQGRGMNWTIFVFPKFFEIELKIYIKQKPKCTDQ